MASVCASRISSFDCGEAFAYRLKAVPASLTWMISMTRLSAKTLDRAPAVWPLYRGFGQRRPGISATNEMSIFGSAVWCSDLKAQVNNKRGRVCDGVCLSVCVCVSGAPCLNSSIVMEPGSAGATFGRQGAKHRLVFSLSLASVHARSSAIFRISRCSTRSAYCILQDIMVYCSTISSY